MKFFPLLFDLEQIQKNRGKTEQQRHLLRDLHKNCININLSEDKTKYKISRDFSHQFLIQNGYKKSRKNGIAAPPVERSTPKSNQHQCKSRKKQNIKFHEVFPISFLFRVDTKNREKTEQQRHLLSDLRQNLISTNLC